MLRVALEELSEQIWQDGAAVDDAPLGRGEGRVLGLLPPITFRQDRRWRRQMARCFDDLAADLTETGTVQQDAEQAGAFPLAVGGLLARRPASVLRQKS